LKQRHEAASPRNVTRRKRVGPRRNFDTMPLSSLGNHLIFRRGLTRNVI